MRHISDSLFDFASRRGRTESLDPPLVEVYGELVESGLSELCNDANLVLYKILELEQRGWPDWCDEENTHALQQIATTTLGFSRDVRSTRSRSGYKALDALVHQGAVELSANVRTHQWRGLEMDHERAIDAFLGIAVRLEGMLGNMLRHMNGE